MGACASISKAMKAEAADTAPPPEPPKEETTTAEVVEAKTKGEEKAKEETNRDDVKVVDEIKDGEKNGEVKESQKAEKTPQTDTIVSKKSEQEDQKAKMVVWNEEEKVEALPSSDAVEAVMAAEPEKIDKVAAVAGTTKEEKKTEEKEQK